MTTFKQQFLGAVVGLIVAVMLIANGYPIGYILGGIFGLIAQYALTGMAVMSALVEHEIRMARVGRQLDGE